MYLIPCGEGTRSCLGCNLGLGELYIMLVAVLRKLKKLLFATDLGEVNTRRDWFVPQPRADTKRVKTIVVGKVGSLQQAFFLFNKQAPDWLPTILISAASWISSSRLNAPSSPPPIEADLRLTILFGPPVPSPVASIFPSRI